MPRSLVPLMLALGMVAAACGSPAVRPLGTPSTGFPQCEEVPNLAAPPDAYRPEPIYVGNEMPVDEVREWAQTKPDYQGIWIDREHNGWITVAFTGDVEAVQQELLEVFPDAGVVAVEVAATAADLESLQARLYTQLRDLELSDRETSFGMGTFENKGVVGLTVNALTPELATILDDHFAGEPLCIDAPDPALLPEPGPQLTGGDGWRLLVDLAPAGEAYRTGIAYDAASLADLWGTIGLDQSIPEVDFETEVVIWFGAVYGSSCPNLRLDDVVVDGTTVYALIVLPDQPVACTADANPHAYVVALDRSKLPSGPFVIQLDADGPPGGAPEERTVVEADLSVPGSVAGPDQVGPDPSLPQPFYVQSGDIVETEFPQPYLFYIHCGIEWLGEFNDVIWRTDSPMPPEWTSAAIDESLEMEFTMFPGDPPTIEAAANGVTVVYEPSPGPIPGCE